MPALAPRRMKERIAFVRQQDILLEHLTGNFCSNVYFLQTVTDNFLVTAVRETLRFAAELRLPADMNQQTKELIVVSTMAGVCS